MEGSTCHLSHLIFCRLTGSFGWALPSLRPDVRLRECQSRDAPEKQRRQAHKLSPTHAQTVIAAAILRHLHAVITTGRPWDPSIATHGTRPKRDTPIAA